MTEEQDAKQSESIAEVKNDIKWIRESLIKMESCMVTKTEFDPVKKLYDRISTFSIGAILLVGVLVVGLYAIAKEKFQWLP
jgi:hypothetical protein